MPREIISYGQEILVCPENKQLYLIRIGKYSGILASCNEDGVLEGIVPVNLLFGNSPFHCDLCQSIACKIIIPPRGNLSDPFKQMKIIKCDEMEESRLIDLLSANSISKLMK